MKRIGIAASKMAKDRIIVYNVYVIVISFLLSLFIFILAGSMLIFAFTIISYVGNEIMPSDFEKDWSSIFAICMISLSTIIVLFTLFAIFLNVKIQKMDKKHVN